jgi:Asp-tRNA(Asn)/Glu-tRNA(Gln) amidotransferase A subunit family amidase
MTYDVLVTKINKKQYTAHALLFPNITATGHNERDVLEQVQRAIAELCATSRIVSVDVPTLSRDEGDDPWIRFAGAWKDDPDWDMFQEEIKTFREEIDQNQDEGIS